MSLGTLPSLLPLTTQESKVSELVKMYSKNQVKKKEDAIHAFMQRTGLPIEQVMLVEEQSNPKIWWVQKYYPEQSPTVTNTGGQETVL